MQKYHAILDTVDAVKSRVDALGRVIVHNAKLCLICSVDGESDNYGRCDVTMTLIEYTPPQVFSQTMETIGQIMPYASAASEIMDGFRLVPPSAVSGATSSGA